MHKLITCFLVVLILVPGGSFGADGSLRKVSLLPHWIPQAQFAGYMVALEKGFYREAGLDLQLLRGGPGKEGFEALDSGKVTFCVEWLSAAMKRRASGLEIVNLGQIVQRSALILVARKESGITRPEDLSGRKVGLWPGLFSLQPEALFRRHKVSPIIVPNYTSMELFLKRGVDAIAAMWYNEYHLLLNSGLNPDELQLFFFYSMGLNFPEDGLYTTEQTFASDPDMCRSFVQASLKGWLYAFQNKDEALAIVMKHADAAQTGTNRAHQRWMLNRMEDLILPENDMARL
ncbi:MAG: ABC transporter substrate-binding protein, partial [Deltaproteobacteria bacterium]|nr:ABC transporter substrate-binding protein [Deltaproteobacteria bacterium]